MAVVLGLGSTEVHSISAWFRLVYDHVFCSSPLDPLVCVAVVLGLGSTEGQYISACFRFAYDRVFCSSPPDPLACVAANLCLHGSDLLMIKFFVLLHLIPWPVWRSC